MLGRLQPRQRVTRAASSQRRNTAPPSRWDGFCSGWCVSRVCRDRSGQRDSSDTILTGAVAACRQLRGVRGQEQTVAVWCTGGQDTGRGEAPHRTTSTSRGHGCGSSSGLRSRSRFLQACSGLTTLVVHTKTMLPAVRPAGRRGQRMCSRRRRGGGVVKRVVDQASDCTRRRPQRGLRAGLRSS